MERKKVIGECAHLQNIVLIKSLSSSAPAAAANANFYSRPHAHTHTRPHPPPLSRAPSAARPTARLPAYRASKQATALANREPYGQWPLNVALNKGQAFFVARLNL